MKTDLKLEFIRMLKRKNDRYVTLLVSNLSQEDYMQRSAG